MDSAVEKSKALAEEGNALWTKGDKEGAILKFEEALNED